MKKIKFVGCLILILILSACAKKAPDQKDSQLVFQMPQKMGNTTFSGSSCFAVNVKSENLLNFPKTECDPEYGDFAGLAPAGSQIELETSAGKDRTIEIFFIHSENGCQQNFSPQMGLAKTFGSDRVYRIAQKKGVTLNPGSQTIEIEIQWPEQNNSLSQLLTLPQSCEKGEFPVDKMKIRQARMVQGEYRGTTNLGNQVHIRVHDKKLQQPSNNWGPRIQSLRLGVSHE